MNSCKHYQQDDDLMLDFPNDYHKCSTCHWRNRDNPRTCNPPGYGRCSIDNQTARVVVLDVSDESHPDIAEYIDDLEYAEKKYKGDTNYEIYVRLRDVKV